MKRYRLYGLIALVALLATSCAIHDPFADNGELGQVLPTVDWEQGSTVVKAGRYATFKGKYYTTAEKAIDHSEVWCLIKREQTATATSKLTTSLAYTKNYSLTDTVRSSQMVATYAHSKAEWDGYEYVLADSFPTSRTLAPVTWVNPSEWDQEKFDSYYPSTFQEEFMAYMVNALTKDSTYYNDLRNVYINYNFPLSLFEQLNAQYGIDFPTDTITADKSNNWFTTDEVDHYYYITVAEDGTAVYHEIAEESAAPAGANVQAVYKSAFWLFSRYSDDTGGKITTVRRQYMPYFKSMIETIPFTSWIYNTADKAYTVNFNRTYYLEPEFRVYDTDGKVGVTTDNKEVTLN
ncbi:MAG: hypothetical protein IJG42_05090 [Muribaculaceae bacterium]|nr:hypothetical protein [Muribaculaceae bacterium]